MQLSILVLVLFKFLISSSYPKPVHALPICRDTCGSVSIKYPFGLDDGCGSTQYRSMLNCSTTNVTTDLFFQTPSGLYRVRSIDYDKHTVVIYDPSMSTCTMLQPRHDFALSELQSVIIPPSTDSVFALLNCSIDSPVLNRYRTLCFNFSGHTCDEIYSTCASFRLMRLPCCFTSYNTLKFMTMNILDCSHYTTVYGVDDLKGVGPLDWTYGIELSYSVADAGCEHCQRSGGTCGYNTETEGMLCICDGLTNSTRDCGKIYELCPSVMNSTTTRDCGIVGNATGGGQRRTPVTLLHVVIWVLKSILGIVL